MQRGIALRAPYGTVFVAQKDGSIWLIYDSSAISTGAIVDHFRNILLEHQSQVMAHDLVMKAAEVPKVVSLGNLPQDTSERPKDAKHNFGGSYRMGAACVVCGVVANGVESSVCEGKKDLGIAPTVEERK